jgi:hypothetical protein
VGGAVAIPWTGGNPKPTKIFNYFSEFIAPFWWGQEVFHFFTNIIFP